MQSNQLFKKFSAEDMSPKPALLTKFELKPTKSGVLDGLKFAIKDVIDIEGYSTSCGNPTWLEDQKPCEANATCVDQLLSNGATCIGKTVLGEFCSGSLGINYFYGMPLNPKAPDRVPGGSSSGSASIVACGEVDFSLGTDVAGSMRVPASFCGIYGFRPSYGLISMSGVKSFCPSFDTVGIFSNCIDVLSRVFEILSGEFIDQSNDKVSSFYVIEDYMALVDSVQRKCFQNFIDETCELLMIKPTYIKLSDLHPDANDSKVGISAIFKNILCAEIWENLGYWINKVDLEFSKTTFVDFSHMKAADTSTLAEAFKRRELYSTILNKLVSSSSILCIPSTPDIAPLRNKGYSHVNEFDYDRLRPLVALSSLAKLPQLNIPIDRTDGPPLGISLLSGYKQDSFLINIAKRLYAYKEEVNKTKKLNP
jgi:amidase